MSFLYTSDDGSVSSDDEEDDEPDIEDDEKDKEVESKRSLSLEESNEYYEEDVVVASDNDTDLSANDKKFVPQLVQESQSTTLTHQHDVLDSACSDDDNEIILFQPTSAASHPLAISHLEISSFCTTSTSNSGDADDGESLSCNSSSVPSSYRTLPSQLIAPSELLFRNFYHDIVE